MLLHLVLRCFLMLVHRGRVVSVGDLRRGWHGVCKHRVESLRLLADSWLGRPLGPGGWMVVRWLDGVCGCTGSRH